MARHGAHKIDTIVDPEGLCVCTAEASLSAIVSRNAEGKRPMATLKRELEDVTAVWTMVRDMPLSNSRCSLVRRFVATPVHLAAAGTAAKLYTSPRYYLHQ